MHSNMKRAQCQTVMDTVIYILCGVSITLAVCSIVINVRRRNVEESKRKTKTSTAVKSRYNQKAYDVISVRVPKDLAAAFREKCDAEGAVQAQIIKRAIEEFLQK